MTFQELAESIRVYYHVQFVSLVEGVPAGGVLQRA